MFVPSDTKFEIRVFVVVQCTIHGYIPRTYIFVRVLCVKREALTFLHFYMFPFSALRGSHSRHSFADSQSIAQPSQISQRKSIMHVISTSFSFLLTAAVGSSAFVSKGMPKSRYVREETFFHVLLEISN